jgi:hypothetical protein
MGRRMKSRGSTKLILLIFSLCAFGDFVWSYVRGRSITEGVISAVLGLFGTAWFAFCFLSSEKDNPKSDPNDPRELGRWVP